MKAKRRAIRIKDVHAFLIDLFRFDVHAKRVYSLANGTIGVMTGASLAVHSVGHGLAQARGLNNKHAIKQVDRLLSNQGVDVWEIFENWVPQVVGERKEIVVAMDWTDYDRDDQATLALNLVTKHGRATPLMWMTVIKSELKEKQNEHEYRMLLRFLGVLPEDVKVTLLADRGFDDHKFMDFVHNLCGFDFVIRFRGNIVVTSEKGVTKPAKEWVGKRGRAKTIRNARITGKRYEVSTVVCVHAKGMKDPWCIASSIEKAYSRRLINYYAKRWSIEPSFRDTKDLHFGMGMSLVRMKNPERRDRLLLLSAFAVVILTILGAAGESLGFDRMLKANTVKHRTHSLFRQGSMWYDLIPNMPEERLRPLMERFGELVQQHKSFRKVYEIV